MRRGTTPTNTFTVDIDLTQAEVIYITYKQGPRTVIEKGKEDITITAKALEVALTQADTLKLKPGDVEIQIRAKLPGGAALASDIITAPAERILKDGEI